MAGDDGLRIELLGRFRVAAGPRAVDEEAWRLRKARSLVKLLALAPEHRLHRERVIEALWPDRDAAAAANNLRQAVFVARRALDSCGVDGARRLVLGPELLALAGDVDVDADAFEAAAAAAEHGAADVARHEAALARYGGELLPEDRLEEWSAVRRELLRERHLGLLVVLAGLHERAGDPAAAIAALQQALLDEPLDERVHRDLMRLYALTGRRQRGLAQYHVLRESLRREFADEPDEATRRLYRDILTRKLGAPEAGEPAPASRRPAVPRSPGNLPLQLTSFVGRERELGEIAGLLRRARLLTLTGPGGCGKTRLALEVAARRLRDFPGGVWLVELAGLADGGLVAHAAAAVLGTDSRSGRAPEEALAAQVGERRMLLVLDTCEHLVDACARLAQRLLTSCPNLVVLATTREPLRVPGEIGWRVPSLTLPDPATEPSVASLERSEAVRLFSDRAANVASRFALSAENGPAVAEICRRLDGIPLAIELAAARVGVLAPGQIAERLRDSLTVLAPGGRGGLTRQQTLTATIDWSHDLLDADERSLFRRLGVFAGSCSLEAVEAVCGEAALDVLGRLVDKSLVVVEEDAGAARYRLLDSVGHYARDRLAQAGEVAGLEAAHRAYFLSLAEAAEPAVSGPDPRVPRPRLGPEQDDLRAALASALRSDPEVGLRLAAALASSWDLRGERAEGERWLAAAVGAAPEPTPERARALLGLAILRLRLGENRRAQWAAEEMVAVCRALADPLATAEALHLLAAMRWVCSAGDVERAYDESRALAERIGAERVVAAVLHTIGVIAGARRAPEARERLDASLALLRAQPPDGPPLLLPVRLGLGLETPGPGRAPRFILEETFVAARSMRPGQAVAHVLADRATMARDRGDVAAARADLEESLAIARRLGDASGSAQALGRLGNLLSVAGEHDLARELHEESLALREARGEARGIGLCLSDLGLAAARAGEPERGRALLERARALFERTDDRPALAGILAHLGYLAADTGRPAEAAERLERALELYADVLDYALAAGWMQVGLAELDAAAGRTGREQERLRDAQRQFRRVGERAGLNHCERRLRTSPHAALTAD